MNEEEAQLFVATLAALSAEQKKNESASVGLIKDAEPMTATCEVEYSE